LQTELGLDWYDYGFRFYDPAIGRFPSVDPISSDFPHVSPFNYAENRPIDGIDLWGLQWSSVHDKKTNTTTFTVNLKVKNSADLTESEVYATAFAIASQVEESFTGEDKETGEKFVTKVSIDFDSEVNEETDFYLNFVDEVENSKGEKMGSWVPGKVDEIGNTKINRIQIRLATGEPVNEIKRTGAHEVGHTGGLRHNVRNKNVDKNGLPVGPNNLMRQTGVVSEGEDVSKRTIINTEQLNHINETVKENEL
jgi:RHS repeat-associated protein